MDSPPFINNATVYNVTDDVRIICQSSATPTPRRIMWQRDNVELFASALLTISSIQRSDDDVYTCCVLRVIAGEEISTCSNFTITVQCEYHTYTTNYCYK